MHSGTCERRTSLLVKGKSEMRKKNGKKNLADVGLRGDQVDEARHGGHAVQHALVHVLSSKKKVRKLFFHRFENQVQQASNRIVTGLTSNKKNRSYLFEPGKTW